MTQDTLTDLHHGWQLAEAPSGADHATLSALPEAAWTAAAVPGSAHGALLAAGRIPDPFFGTNETEVRWVGERAWAWRLHFDVDQLAPHEDLVFEGLDTYCSVWLNGLPLFSSDNMFVPQRVDVRKRLRRGRNELMLRFDPPLARAREQEAALGRRQLWNGDSARLYARKAQYHFGWDWGPELLTCGPWKAVRRHSWQVRIDDVPCRPRVDVAARTATVRVRTALAGDTAGLRVELELLDPQGRSVARATHAAEADGATLSVADAQLWWPRGMGEQPLYTLVTRVTGAAGTLAEDRRRIGLRTLRLVQEPVQGEGGKSFFFEVNGQPFFAGGANWIPDDSLLERITPERYRERVAQAAEANMTMLRVWGGGIYEDDAFYEACDELGLLVWQDFMFACGMYPAHDAFRASVRDEARAAIKRLRHHASLALWCGNNEDYAVAESIGAYGPHAQLDRFDARAIYEKLLPEVCAELDPDRTYWPGSPYSPNPTGITGSSDASVGDRHSWEVWHQQMLPYQRYGEVQARFVSEFGMQSHASLGVLESVLPADERFPESRTAMWHNKAGGSQPDGHRRLAVYLADNLRVGPTLAEQVYATQFVQAEAMRFAYQDFRRRWQRPGARAVGGALVWQLNDCWPVTSWALIDSSGTVKPAWHTIRRALATVAVAARLEAAGVRLAVMNSAAEPRAIKLQLRVFSLSGRSILDTSIDCIAPASVTFETLHALPALAEPVMAELRAIDADGGAEIARDCAWAEPFKFHRHGGARIDVQATDAGLRVVADLPVKGLWLHADGARFLDNFIDLVPGEPRLVAIEGGPLAAVHVVALDHAGRVVDLAR
ncbi:glycosyl hydrolase 2 galactose-binding domain-containing protein [Ideonella sp. YS5]|uniref:glycoside hydrolase family 2 protein n=1 Tax=Ideonella sp. YS5 TaxID=3453714 RepID=UPI003EEC77F3